MHRLHEFSTPAFDIVHLPVAVLSLVKSVSVVSIRELDPGLQEAVSTLIWAAPRLQAEVSELKIVSASKSQQPQEYLTSSVYLLDLSCLLSESFLQVSEQLCAKYSKEYGKLCRTNQIGTVNDRVGFFSPPAANGPFQDYCWCVVVLYLS